VAISVLFLGGLLSVGIVLAIFSFIFTESLPLVTDPDQRNEMSLYHDTENEDEFARTASVFQTLDNMLGQIMWQPVSEQPLFSLWPLMAGTLKITLVAVVEGSIISFLTALAIAFYLPKKLRYAVKVITELLSFLPLICRKLPGRLSGSTPFWRVPCSL